MAAVYKYSGVVLDANGDPNAGALVIVYAKDTRKMATLYTGADKATPATNPILSDGDGSFSFYAAAGYYTVKIRSTDVDVFQTIRVDLPSLISKGSSSSTSGTNDHTKLSNIGTNTHAQVDTAISNSSGHIAAEAPHSGHAASAHTHDYSASNHTHSDLHAHSNSAQLALVTDGDHDVRTDNPHTVTLAQVGGTTDHTALSNIGSNTHSQIDTAITNSETHLALTGLFKPAVIPFLPDSSLYISNTMTAQTLGTNAGVANRQDVVPWVAPVSWTCTSAGCSISTLVASAKVRVVVFNSDSNGRPTTVFGTSADIDAGSTGTKFDTTVSWSFVKGKLYWIGLWHSSTATVRIVNATTNPLVSTVNAATPTFVCRLVRTGITFSSANTTWSYAAANHADNIGGPLVMFKAS